MRVINETWTGVGFAIEQGEQQRTSPEGFPMMRPDGSPDMEPTTVLMLVHQTPEKQWIIRIPFTEEAKAKLLQSLTGASVVTANMGDLKNLGPLH